MKIKYFLLTIMILTGAFLYFVYQYYKSYDLNQKNLIPLQESLEEKQKDNEKLRDYSKRLQSDPYTLERTFRDEFNYTRKNDSIFIFEEDKKLEKHLLENQEN